MAISVTIILTSAGANTGPNFNLSCPTGIVTPNTATKSELLSGKTVTISDDGATQIDITSLGDCTNTLSISVPAITSTTTTTTTAVPTTTSTTTTTTTVAYTAEIFVFPEDDGLGNTIFTGNVIAGTTADNLTFDFVIQRYSDISCSSFAVACPNDSVILNSGNTTVSSSGGCSTGVAQTLKITSLQVNLINISSPDQVITIGLNTYRIIGYDTCQGL